MRHSLLNHPVDVLSMDETVSRIREAMISKSRLHHVALNIAKLVEIHYNGELRDDVHAADIVGIDGMGIVFALRMDGVDVPERVAGVDLMGQVLALCAKEGFRPYFLGATPQVIATAVEVAQRDYPGLVIAGAHDGYFKPEDEAEIISEIRTSGADCLFVGMPTPRKERFLAKHRAALDVPFIMGVGGSFDVMAGKVQRAPERMQRSGLEWLYRVYQEPQRMWWRYLRTNTLFVYLFGFHLLARFKHALTLANSAGHHAPQLNASGRPNQALPPPGTPLRKVGWSLLPAQPAQHVDKQPRLPWQLVAELLIACELLSVVVAGELAIFLYGKLGFFAVGLRDVAYLVPTVICAAVIWYKMKSEGMLSLNAILLRQNGEWRKTLTALLHGALVTVAVGYALQVSGSYSRGWFFLWMLASAIALCAMRRVSRSVMRRLLQSRTIERRVAIVSSGPAPAHAIEAIAREPSITVTSCHVLDPKQIGTQAHGELELLVETLIAERVKEVILLDQGFDGEQLSRIVGQINVLPIDVYVQPSSFAGHIPILGVERTSAGSVLKVGRPPLGHWSIALKSFFDFCVALVALIVLSPIMLCIALAIKLDSKGPVLFRQRRHGFFENEFDVYKFRTMHSRPVGEKLEQARRGDPRVTRVGWWLRRTSLDELPQLFNVLIGNMSLVGPRPHALEHHQLFRQHVRRYTARHRVKPGITGLSQINGLRGECDSVEKIRNRIEMDIYYVENWSFLLDLRILLLTPAFGLVSKNAY